MPLSITFTFSPGAIIFASRFNQNFSDVQVWANAHEIATTGVHGVGAGQIVGTTLTQTISNKTFSAPLLFDNTAAGDIAATLSGVSANVGLNIIPKGTGSISIGSGISNPQGKLYIQGGNILRDGGWNSALEIRQNTDFASIIFSAQTTANFSAISWNTSTSGNDITKELANIQVQWNGTTTADFTVQVNPNVGVSNAQSGKGLSFVGSLLGMIIGDVTANPGGTTTVKQWAQTSGNFKVFETIGAAHTGLTASAEVVDVDFNLNRVVQRATGAVATQRAMRVQAPTYSFVGASIITDAITFDISGPPVAGANATITNGYAIRALSGYARFDGGLQLGGLDATAFINILQPAVNSGNFAGIRFTGAAHTGLTASAETRDLDINLNRIVQHATGAIATQRAAYIQAPTYAFVGASTITDAITVSISGAPAAGTNATLTNPMALRVESGASSFGGNVGIGIKNPGSSLVVSDTAIVSAVITSSNTTTTGLDITNTSSGGINWRLQSLGSAGRTANFEIVNATSATAAILITSTGLVGVNPAFTSPTARFEVTHGAASSGTPTLVRFTNAAHTNQTLSTEVPELDINLAQTKQWATGNFAAQRAVKIAAPTYSAVGASTITAAATLYVSGAPIAGTNMTLTNSYAAWFGAGIRIDNTVALGGGAAPTFGTIGGAGPATAAQNSWMRVDDATGARWVPCWR